MAHNAHRINLGRNGSQRLDFAAIFLKALARNHVIFQLAPIRQAIRQNIFLNPAIAHLLDAEQFRQSGRFIEACRAHVFFHNRSFECHLVGSVYCSVF